MQPFGYPLQAPSTISCGQPPSLILILNASRRPPRARSQSVTGAHHAQLAGSWVHKTNVRGGRGRRGAGEGAMGGTFQICGFKFAVT